MKNKHLNILAAVFLSFGLMFLNINCTNSLSQTDKPIDVETETGSADSRNKNTEYIPIAIQFISTDIRRKSVQPKDLVITIIDQYKQLITAGNTSILNQQDFKLSGTILNLKIPTAILKELPDNRYAFTIKASANNFLDIIHRIIIKDNKGIYQPIYMTPDIEGEEGKFVKSLPNGIVASKRNFRYRKNKGTQGRIVINNNNKEQAVPTRQNNLTVAVDFQPQTIFRDKSNTPINSGTGTAKLYTFDPQHEVPLQTFPNGYYVPEALERVEGGVRDIRDTKTPFFFSVFGYIDLNVHLGNSEVKQLSKPAKIRANVTPINKEQFPFKEGQSISIWYLDEDTGIWIREETTEVISRNNGLEIEFEIDHLSILAFAGTLPKCSSPLNVDFTNVHNTNHGTRTLRMNYGGGMANYMLNLPADLNFGLEVPQSSNVDLTLLSSSYHNSPPLRTTSFNPCINTLKFNIDSIQKTNQLCEQIEFVINCGVECYHPDDIALHIKLNQGLSYNYVGTFHEGKINFDGFMIVPGKQIEFKLYYNNNVIFSLNTLIRQNLNSNSSLSPFMPLSFNGGTFTINRFKDTNTSCNYKSLFDITLNNCNNGASLGVDTDCP